MSLNLKTQSYFVIIFLVMVNSFACSTNESSEAEVNVQATIDAAVSATEQAKSSNNGKSTTSKPEVIIEKSTDVAISPTAIPPTVTPNPTPTEEKRVDPDNAVFTCLQRSCIFNIITPDGFQPSWTLENLLKRPRWSGDYREIEFISADGKGQIDVVNGEMTWDWQPPDDQIRGQLDSSGNQLYRPDEQEVAYVKNGDVFSIKTKSQFEPTRWTMTGVIQRVVGWIDHDRLLVQENGNKYVVHRDSTIFKVESREGRVLSTDPIFDRSGQISFLKSNHVFHYVTMDGVEEISDTKNYTSLSWNSQEGWTRDNQYYVFLNNTRNIASFVAIAPKGASKFIRYPADIPLNMLSDVTFSPSDSRFAFAKWQRRSDEESGGIFIVNVENETIRRVTEGYYYAQSLFWPRDDLFVYVITPDRGEAHEIGTWVQPVDGEEPQHLFGFLADEVTAMPDGRLLIVANDTLWEYNNSGTPKILGNENGLKWRDHNYFMLPKSPDEEFAKSPEAEVPPNSTSPDSLDPNGVFVQYYKNSAAVWKIDENNKISELLTFDIDDIPKLGNWNNDYTGWEIARGRKKGGTLLVDGSIVESPEAIRVLENGCSSNVITFRWDGICGINPDRTEKVFTKNNDIYSANLETGKETNWSKNGFFNLNNGILLLIGWIDKDHILITNDETQKTFILRRDGTLTEVSTLGGFILDNIQRDPTLKDSDGYIEYAYRVADDDSNPAYYHVYHSRKWTKVIENTSIKYYGYTDDRQERIFLVPSGVAFLNEQDEINVAVVPSKLQSMWYSNTILNPVAFNLYVDHLSGGSDRYPILIKKDRDGVDHLLLYDSDVRGAKANGWGGVWLWNLETGQVDRLNEHLISRLFWLDPETIFYSVNYTIDGVPAPDMGTWIQKTDGSNPVKIEIYRATSATMLPSTGEVLFVANGILYKYDGSNVTIVAEEFYDGDFYWPSTGNNATSDISISPSKDTTFDTLSVEEPQKNTSSDTLIVEQPDSKSKTETLTLIPTPTVPANNDSPSTSSPASPSAPARPAGRIALATDDYGASEIALLNLGSGNVTRLTSNPAHDWAPALSPDGSRLAYVSNFSGQAEIYVMPSGGGPANQLTFDGAADDHPTWAGGRILFASERDGNWNIFSINSDGSDLRRLTDHQARDIYPVASPDGNKTAFISERDGVQGLYLMNSDGSGVTSLVTTVPKAWSPAWSPDGRQLVFVSVEHDGYLQGSLYRVNTDGSNLQSFIDSSGYGLVGYPSWSSDGNYVAYAHIINNGSKDLGHIYYATATGQIQGQLYAPNGVSVWGLNWGQ